MGSKQKVRYIYKKKKRGIVEKWHLLRMTFDVLVPTTYLLR